MRTALDTSVLIAIAKQGSDSAEWVLANARMDGDLVINEVVAAEYCSLVLDDAKFRQTLRELGILYEASLPATAMLAGRLFRRYRDEGGPRNHLIPDFLIGAHALTQADQMAAKDRGFFRRYFPKVKLLTVRP